MRRIVWLASVVGAFPILCTIANAQQLPDAPGKSTVQKVCGGCHPSQIVLGRGMTREQWSKNVATMVQRGAKITDAEFVQVVDYLASQFPPGAAKPLVPIAGSPPTAAPRRAAVGMGWGP